MDNVIIKEENESSNITDVINKMKDYMTIKK
jgi:hypothetical protein